MKKAILTNGLRAIYHKKKGSSVVIQAMINIGSNNETADQRGISHFIEHMLFEGTKRRPTNRTISNEIEKIGGDFNAYTTNERTCIYVKVLKKHFGRAVDILADVLQNSLFTEEHITKEKSVVQKEIDMIHDEPSFCQWILLQKNLFSKHPARFPAYGDKKIIKNITKKEIVQYFNKYYVAENITLSIVGDVKKWKKELNKKFKLKRGKPVSKTALTEPVAKRSKIKKVKKNIANSYLILGFKTVPQKHPDSYVLEVINGVLGRGQSGKMFDEIRSKRGLAYEVGTQNVNEVSFGYFAVHASIQKKNIDLVKKLMLKELQKLSQISQLDLKEAKTYIEGNYLLELEDSQKIADQLLFWEQVEDARIINDFLKKIKKISINDIKRVAEKYFKYHTMVVLEGK